jgi:hypothetical protein
MAICTSWKPKIRALSCSDAYQTLPSSNKSTIYQAKYRDHPNGGGAMYNSNFCYWCAASLNKTQRTRDHLIPKCQGGSDDSDNIRWACRECNNSRGDLQSFYGVIKQLKDQLPRWKLMTEEQKRIWRAVHRSATKRMLSMVAFRKEWVDYERHLLGWSPSASLCFRLPPDPERHLLNEDTSLSTPITIPEPDEDDEDDDDYCPFCRTHSCDGYCDCPD